MLCSTKHTKALIKTDGEETSGYLKGNETGLNESGFVRRESVWGESEAARDYRESGKKRP